MLTSLKRNRNLHSKAVTVASGMTSLIATWNEHNTVSCIQMLTAGQCFKKRVITSSARSPYMRANVTIIWCCVTSVNRTERETWSLNYVASLYSFGWNFQRQGKKTPLSEWNGECQVTMLAPVAFWGDSPASHWSSAEMDSQRTSPCLLTASWCGSLWPRCPCRAGCSNWQRA